MPPAKEDQKNDPPGSYDTEDAQASPEPVGPRRTVFFPDDDDDDDEYLSPEDNGDGDVDVDDDDDDDDVSARTLCAHVNASDANHTHTLC